MAKSEKYDIPKMVKIVNEYTKNTELPILAECLLLNNWSETRFREWASRSEDLTNAVKNLKRKKEIVLEKGGLTGKYDKTMAIFSLKQLGWKDRVEQDNTINSNSQMEVKIVGMNEEDIDRVKKLREGLFKSD